jgi:hypothetical protein
MKLKYPSDIKVNTLLPVKMQKGKISPNGIKEIDKVVQKLFSKPDPYLLDGVDWVWMNNTGALTKRLESLLYKTNAVKLDESQLSLIGNIAKQNMQEEDGTPFLISFSDDFSWVRGDFADDSSCLFDSGRRYAFDFLKKAGALMIRVYHNVTVEEVEKTPKHILKSQIRPHFKNKYEHVPYARGFLYPVVAFENQLPWQHDNDLLIMNGYARGRDTDYLATIVQTALGYASKYPAIAAFANAIHFYLNPGVRLIGQKLYTDQQITTLNSHLFTSRVLLDERDMKDLREHVCASCAEVYGADQVSKEGMHIKCVVLCPACGRAGNKKELQEMGLCRNCSAWLGFCACCGETHFTRWVSWYTNEETSRGIPICYACAETLEKIGNCSSCRQFVLPTSEHSSNCPNCGKMTLPNFAQIVQLYPIPEVIQREYNGKMYSLTKEQRLRNYRGLINYIKEIASRT